MSILNDQPQENTIYGLSGTPKTMFFLGLSMGVGSMAVLGLAAGVVFLINGPTNVFAKGTNNANAAAGQVANAGAQPTDPAAAAADPTAQQPPAQPVPAVTKDDHIRGKDTAKVTLIEYSDFQCPYCVRHEDTLKAIEKKYPNDVRVVYRHFPLSSLHPFAEKAAEASECASAQGKFWEMHDKLFSISSSATGLSIDAMKQAAKDIGIDTNKFNTCLDKGEMASKVAKSYQDGMAAGVSGTPAVFVNGKIAEGAIPLDQFEALVTGAGAKS
jgi:protein-disulfide isomerase